MYDKNQQQFELKQNNLTILYKSRGGANFKDDAWIFGGINWDPISLRENGK